MTNSNRLKGSFHQLLGVTERNRPKAVFYGMAHREKNLRLETPFVSVQLTHSIQTLAFMNQYMDSVLDSVEANAFRVIQTLFLQYLVICLVS